MLAFLRGASYLVRAAILFLVLWRQIWRLLLVPVSLAAVASWLCAVEIRSHVSHVTRAVETHASLASIAGGVGHVAMATALVSAGWILFVLYLFLSGPFNDRVSERVERRRLGDRAPRGGLWRSLVDLVHELPRLVFYLALVGVAYAASLLWRPILPAGSFLATATYLAYGALDYSMARRGYGFREKRRLLAHHRAETLGLGVAETALALVPGVNLLVPTLAAIAGTSLFLDLEERAAVAAGAGTPVATRRAVRGR